VKGYQPSGKTLFKRIIARMGDSSLPFGIERSRLRLDSRDPYFCLHFIMIFVRDQERSLRFYIDQLDFRLVVDQRFESGGRWIEIAPPDGNARLSLALATPNSEVYKLVGQDTRIYFITEDVNAKFNEWSSRGVRFQFPPQEPEWGGTFTRFEDLEGNSFGLAGFDELTLEVESQRRAIAQKLESERRAALQAREVGGDYYDFLDLGRERLVLVIGDIAGKGIAGALLMANLQANLRSQCAIAKRLFSWCKQGCNTRRGDLARLTAALNFRPRLDAYPLAANPANGSPVAPCVIISVQTAAVRDSQHRCAIVHVH
jgi:catechol 2,3-dioxygenase-like lactoylglutathione lyase family enzyme